MGILKIILGFMLNIAILGSLICMIAFNQNRIPVIIVLVLTVAYLVIRYKYFKQHKETI